MSKKKTARTLSPNLGRQRIWAELHMTRPVDFPLLTLAVSKSAESVSCNPALKGEAGAREGGRGGGGRGGERVGGEGKGGEGLYTSREQMPSPWHSTQVSDNNTVT